MHTFNPSIWKPDAGQVMSEFRNSLDYKERPCLKKNKKWKEIYTFMCVLCVYLCVYVYTRTSFECSSVTEYSSKCKALGLILNNRVKDFKGRNDFSPSIF